jgi:hypothetical protein
VQADGTRVLADGTKILTDGTEIRVDGTKVLADGTKVRTDGTIVRKDGTEIRVDGTTVTHNGTKVSYLRLLFEGIKFKSLTDAQKNKIETDVCEEVKKVVSAEKVLHCVSNEQTSRRRAVGDLSVMVIFAGGVDEAAIENARKEMEKKQFTIDGKPYTPSVEKSTTDPARTTTDPASSGSSDSNVGLIVGVIIGVIVVIGIGALVAFKMASGPSGDGSVSGHGARPRSGSGSSAYKQMNSYDNPAYAAGENVEIGASDAV